MFQMSFSASRATRLLLAAAVACLGLALSAQAAHATLAKVQIDKINVGGDPAQVFTFGAQLTGWGNPPPPATINLTGGQTSGPIQVECNGSDCPAGVTNTIVEQATLGYTLSKIECHHTQGSQHYWPSPPDASSPLDTDTQVDLATGKITFELNLHEWVRCYVTNTRNDSTPPPTSDTPPTSQPPTSQPPTSQPPAEPAAASPQIAVSPVRVQPGSARLSGPSGCPTTSAVAASVSGRQIVKVTFYVDGKKVKTLTKTNRKGQWVLPMNVKRFAFGTHRVRVTVQFAKSSQTKAKTLRLSFSRCHPATVTPKFTG